MPTNANELKLCLFVSNLLDLSYEVRGGGLTDACSLLLSNDAQGSSLMIQPIMYVCMYVHVCMYVCMQHVCTYVCMYAFIYLFVCQNWPSSLRTL